ncbi:hypothetical protein C8J56DRAFT_896241 [Mycena floridula]|nr:hypothetical protein C8J56DRAFT_896241 [Mycena floridula]
MGVWHRGEKGSKKVLKDPQMLTNKGVKASQARWFNSAVLSGKTKVTSSRLQLFMTNLVQANFLQFKSSLQYSVYKSFTSFLKPVISLVKFSNSVKVQHQSSKFISLIVTIVILAAVVIGIIKTLRDKQEEFNNPRNLPLIPPTRQVANPLRDQLWEVLYLLGNTKKRWHFIHLVKESVANERLFTWLMRSKFEQKGLQGWQSSK